MNKQRSAIHKLLLPAVAAVFAAATMNIEAAQSLPVKEDVAQLHADKEALQRQLKRMEIDEARLQADTKSGRMSAESKDAFAVYKAQKAVKGEAKDVTMDQVNTLQMKADKEALQRQIRRLELAENTLKADTAEGKMSAMSRDSERVYKDSQAVKAEKKQIQADQSKLRADEKRK